ncbi:hypothetical protein [Pontiella sulfatireligans]|uniref:Beta-porphyranase A n=1 Tax=Pontiella sulfatireligans TaxID=2750658 RepID=A0A6C2UWC6_9BACT|nr:hypothetical protein [Pontiella sulfatireligans]VGO23494.1 Beta-porphyranase A [Pontiella sulfatireligans]
MFGKRSVGIVLLYLFATGAIAQTAVDINLNVRHTVGGVSEFDREKYIVLHAGLTDGDWDSDVQRESFLNGYDVYLGRNNGSMPWNLSQTTEDPAKPGWCNHSSLASRGITARNNYALETEAHALEFRANKMMHGGQMSMYPNGITNNVQKNFAFADGDYDALGDYFENYLTDFFGAGGMDGQPKPTMVEVVNEPFVTATKYSTTRANISRMHTNVAAAIKNSHPEVLVGGYTAAHPQYEGNNSSFSHWEANWKTFIDIAGTNMDFFSLHLYDNPQGSTNVLDTMYRSGSNVEALLDMIEHYSMLKLGEVKPFNISEYGSLSVTNGAPYEPNDDWGDVRSFSTIMMQLLERPDRIVQAIPFVILKAEWGRKDGYPYPTRLLYDVDELTGSPKDDDGPWAYTHRLKFFELWKEVNGTRVETVASDPDIQVDAYVNVTNAFVIVSSLDHTGPQTVDLNVLGAVAGLQSIEVKHAYAAPSGEPMFDNYITNDLPSITLPASSTAVIKYTYAHAVQQNEQATEEKYYATTYLQPISANTPIIFSITNVAHAAPFGEAVLRLGLGRNHGDSLQPTLLVNGTAVPVPTDWRGYDQSTRNSFYGVLEIPVPYALLQSSNTISVEFNDADGGYVASVAMQVFEFSADIRNPPVYIPIDYHQIVGSDIILGFTNGPADSFFSLHSKTNLMDSAWSTTQTNLPIDGTGAGSVTHSIIAPQEFFRLVEDVVLSAPFGGLIEFTAPDYSNAPLDGQQSWNAEAQWAVADAAGSGHAATAQNSEIAVLNEAVTLGLGQTYSLSVNLEFGGTYSTPTAHVYAFLSGLKVDNTASAHVETGDAVSADASIQIISGTDDYRLLNNWAPLGSQITTATLDAGDILQYNYELTLGSHASNTTYTVQLQNLTDGTDTGVGTVAGVHADVYAALTGSGAYAFVQRIAPGNGGSGLTGLQVNSVTISKP